ncbi:MAG: hypothetical protein FH761_16590 [Firmicutes bacterium]|nr:hypothetical protein [Bacillota bacterium]
MATLEELIVEIDADSSGLDNILKKSTKGLNSFGSTLKKVGGLVAGAFAVKKIVDFGEKAIDLAADAEEVQNKFDVVFGNLGDDAEEFASSFSNAVGRSRNETKKLLADTQDLLTGFGATKKEGFKFSKQIQQLGVDLASFNNLQDADAVERLRKGLLGETENLKALGIVINQNVLKQEAMRQGYGDNLNELTELEKIQLRYSLAVQQSQNAVGDAERSSQSFTNQLKRLKSTLLDSAANFGQKLLPVATKFLIFVNKSIPVLNKFKTKIADALGKALKPVADVLKTFGNNLAKVKDVISNSIEDGISLADTFFRLQEAFKESDSAIGRFVSTVFGNLSKLTKFINNNIVPIFRDITKAGSDIFKGFSNGFQAGLNNLLPTIETLLNNITTKFSKLLPKIINFVVTNAPKLIEAFFTIRSKIIKTILELIPKIVEFLSNNLPQLIKSGKQLMQSILQGIIENIPKLVENFNTIIDTIIQVITDLLPDILDAGVEILLNVINGILNALPQLIDTAISLIDKILEAIVNNLPTILSAGVKILLKLVDGIIDSLPKLIDATMKLIKKLIETITEYLPDIVDSGVDIVLKLIDGLLEALPDLVDVIIFDLIPAILETLIDAAPDLLEAGGKIITSIAEGLLKALSKIVETGSEIGVNIISGMTDGVKEKAKDLAKGVKETVTKAVDGVKDFLGINSPSKLFEDIGINVDEGLIKGIDKLKNNVNDSMTELTVPSINRIGKTIPTLANQNSNSTVNNNNQAVHIQNVNVKNQEDIEAISRRLFNLQKTTDRSNGLVPLG